MDHNLDFLKSHLHENTQGFINCNLDNDFFPVITGPTRITHSSATLIDNIFLGSRLTGQMTSRIIVDDISVMGKKARSNANLLGAQITSRLNVHRRDRTSAC